MEQKNDNRNCRVFSTVQDIAVAVLQKHKDNSSGWHQHAMVQSICRHCRRGRSKDSSCFPRDSILVLGAVSMPQRRLL